MVLFVQNLNSELVLLSSFILNFGSAASSLLGHSSLDYYIKLDFTGPNCWGSSIDFGHFDRILPLSIDCEEVNLLLVPAFMNTVAKILRVCCSEAFNCVCLTILRQVLPGLKSIGETEVLYEDDQSHPFDSIIFATGVIRSTKTWLKGDNYLLNDDGIPKPEFPNHLKGEKGFCGTG
ncbi:hypothetical protein POM88_025676 [Heracleum sosnowskyi]|uniref:Uncharacterized protein n=1 Tax=Heracleum sosnowskyi TaxID=360622 RepID=A0AAD8MN53_9APIA|nr:hypothetical protein POM88_025676 [Heracleum sosnowskyi]